MLCHLLVSGHFLNMELEVQRLVLQTDGALGFHVCQHSCFVEHSDFLLYQGCENTTLGANALENRREAMDAICLQKRIPLGAKYRRVNRSIVYLYGICAQSHVIDYIMYMVYGGS